MINQHVLERLSGIHQMLIGAHRAGSSMSSASKGRERETLIDAFLSQVLTPQFRFGSGDVTDTFGTRSGQLDVVLEYPLVPSLPIVGTDSSRLYLAEGVAAVVEVKSNLASQWHEVEATAAKLSALRRVYGSGVSFGADAGPQIPLFAVGYSGWKDLGSLAARLVPGAIDAALVIDSMLFASTPSFSGMSAAGTPAALWGLIVCLHRAASMGGSTAFGAPIRYAIADGP